MSLLRRLIRLSHLAERRDCRDAAVALEQAAQVLERCRGLDRLIDYEIDLVLRLIHDTPDPLSAQTIME